MYKRRNHVFMAALGAALSAGAAAVATAFDQAEKFAVTGALQVTHIITEQVCKFDTLDQLEGYLEAVADRHHWFRHDQADAGAAQSASTDPTGSSQLAAAIAAADQAAASTASAPDSAVHVNLALDQLATGTAPADAITVTTTEPAAPAAEPVASSDTTEQPAADQAAQ
jgi:hypothetical protein